MYREELHWILDKKSLPFEEAIARRRAFVASLGLKCDVVGWCRLDLADPRRDEILDAIEAFCRAGGWSPRGYYTRTWAEEDPEWYALKTAEFKDSTESGAEAVPMADEYTALLPKLRAFHEAASGPKRCYYRCEPHPFRRACWANCVPDRFRRACLEAHVAGTDFLWLRDVGKFQAEQYFALYPRQLPRAATAWRLTSTDTETIRALGGSFARVAALFPSLKIDLPKVFLRGDLPEGGMAGAYLHAVEPDGFMLNMVLIHRDLAETLLARKALSRAALVPACVMDELPPGYELHVTHAQHRPTAEVLAQRQAEYEVFRRVARPVRLVTDKEALSRLRAAKKERKDDFCKGLPKAQAAALAGTPREALAPYYQLTDGALLSDEYEWLSLAAAQEAQAAYDAEMALEDVEIPGLVIARCADGDTVLLSDNQALRVSHEAPEVIDQWPTLAQFIVDALEDAEI